MENVLQGIGGSFEKFKTTQMRHRLPRHVTIVYNAPSGRPVHPKAPVTDPNTDHTAHDVKRFLDSKGVKTKLFPLRTMNDLKRLRRVRTNLVFNCVEDDIGSSPFTEHLVAKTLADAGIPFTGASAGNILLTTNKAATKQYLLTHGIPTPPFAVVDHPDFMDMTYHLRGLFPLMVKPVSEDGSEGITQRSVVTNSDTLKQQITSVVKTFEQPALVEQFINTREVSVAVIERSGRPIALPPSEVKFKRGFGRAHKILDFDAKWRPRTTQYRHTKEECPADLKPSLTRELTRIALSIWKILDLRGYASIDFRIDEKGNPYVLEVNVNVELVNDTAGGLTGAAWAGGLSWDRLITTFINSALYRHES